MLALRVTVVVVGALLLLETFICIWLWRCRNLNCGENQNDRIEYGASPCSHSCHDMNAIRQFIWINTGKNTIAILLFKFSPNALPDIYFHHFFTSIHVCNAKVCVFRSNTQQITLFFRVFAWLFFEGGGGIFAGNFVVFYHIWQENWLGKTCAETKTSSYVY